MTREKVDATEIYAFEFIKCALSRDFDIPTKQLISDAYEIADLLYDEWQKRFDGIEENEKGRMVDSDGKTHIFS